MRAAIAKHRADTTARNERWQRNLRVAQRKVAELNAEQFESERAAQLTRMLSVWPSRVEQAKSTLDATGERLVALDNLDALAIELARVTDSVDRAVAEGTLCAKSAVTALAMLS